ncbi:hypothetical protein NEOLI_000842 [Neolecta irregularis DAH-3]|uniref:Mitochondrial presequence protease n=1 Tax=Neolecta irregularis (strain DAH-3) TaxID=1198029 RepID=A0A1U7LRG8_NEOID|nr:hypothetical protein NEOLI_000842 [Neolecta irregularis DAH-3]|eukprot:OLL25266.1 hypothetical protein NEOLI_000842 [Neolecta irregularis DAH-3]
MPVHDDSGCPHTLEHLIFLGSRKYPYHGILDLLANKSFAQGTNAWTDTDNTVYDIYTASEDGFLRILPIYIDHVLFPVLQQSAFTTEVYHVNGTGEDGGVVFSEMQGTENTSSSLMALETQRTLFPQGSGYRSETGGLMESLRALDNEKIKEFHKKAYVPRNLAIVIVGKLDHANLLKTLQAMDDDISPDFPMTRDYQRPWVTSPATNRLSKSTLKSVEFPDKDESMGEDLVDATAILMICLYLCDSPIAPLSREFIEIEHPLYISFDISERLESLCTLEFSAVPTAFLQSFESKFFSVLDTVVRDGVDLGRMTMLINKEKLKVRSLLSFLISKSFDAVETSPHNGFTTSIITAVLYGDEQGHDLKKYLVDLEAFDILSTWTRSQWSSSLSRWFIDQPHVTILATPSNAMANRLEKENTQRIQNRITDLGREKLEALDRDLVLAKKENERPIPNSILADFRIPEIESIHFIQSETARVGLGRLDGVLYAGPGSALIDSDNPTQRAMDSHRDLNLWVQLDVTRKNGEKLTWERVVEALDLDFVDYGAYLGVGQSFEDLIVAKVKVAKDKYLEAVDWIYDILVVCHPLSKLTTRGRNLTQNVGVSLSKMINNIPAQRRDGSGMSWALYYDLILDENRSTAKASNFLTQEKFLHEMEQVFEQNPSDILSGLCGIQRICCLPENMRVHIIGPVVQLADPLSPWDMFRCTKEVTPVRYARDLLSGVGMCPRRVATILALPSIESSFSIHFSRGPQDWQHPDLAALLVLAEYLSLVEGYFWKGIRGAGLAYGASLSLRMEEGMIYFSVYRSPNSALAFEKAKEIVEELGSGKQKFDELTLDSAKSSLIYANVSTESTLMSAVWVS